MSVKVIGISGKTGVGKTTLAKALARKLQATSLFWDDFDEISIAPEDYVEWYERGQNYKEWNYASLATVLETLKKGKPVNHPALNYLLEPTKYIIFDAPLARLHKQTGDYIDFCIHIEAPLDISLARRIIRDFKPVDKSKEELLEELEYYLSHSRKLFFDDALKENADLLVDAMMTTKEQLKQVDSYLINYI